MPITEEDFKGIPEYLAEAEATTLILDVPLTEIFDRVDEIMKREDTKEKNNLDIECKKLDLAREYKILLSFVVKEVEPQTKMYSTPLGINHYNRHMVSIRKIIEAKMKVIIDEKSRLRAMTRGPLKKPDWY